MTSQKIHRNNIQKVPGGVHIFLTFCINIIACIKHVLYFDQQNFSMYFYIEFKGHRTQKSEFY